MRLRLVLVVAAMLGLLAGLYSGRRSTMRRLAACIIALLFISSLSLQEASAQDFHRFRFDRSHIISTTAQVDGLTCSDPESDGTYSCTYNVHFQATNIGRRTVRDASCLVRSKVWDETQTTLFYSSRHSFHFTVRRGRTTPDIWYVAGPFQVATSSVYWSAWTARCKWSGITVR